MARIITLDSSVLIALHSKQDQHHDWAVELFTELADFEWSMSALTFAEVLVHPIRAGVEEMFQLSMKNLNIVVSALMPDGAVELARVRANTGVKMPDAVVIHQALASNAQIATTDLGLARAASKLGIEVLHPSSKLA